MCQHRSPMDIWLASRGGEVAAVDAETREVVRRVDLGHVVDALARDGDLVWAVGDRSLSAVDARTGAVASTATVPGRASSLVVTGGEPVVLATGRRPALAWPRSGRSIRLGWQSQALAAGHGSLWIACQRRPGVIERRDPGTGDVTGEFAVHRDPQAIWVGAKWVWVATDGPGGVDRVDPTTGAVDASVEIARQPTALREAFGALWVTHGSEPRLTRIDPDPLVVTATIRVGAGAFGIGVAERALWLTQALASRVCVVDPRRNGVRGRFDWDAPFAIC